MMRFKKRACAKKRGDAALLSGWSPAYRRQVRCLLALRSQEDTHALVLSTGTVRRLEECLASLVAFRDAWRFVSVCIRHSAGAIQTNHDRLIPANTQSALALLIGRPQRLCLITPGHNSQPPSPTAAFIISRCRLSALSEHPGLRAKYTMSSFEGARFDSLACSRRLAANYGAGASLALQSMAPCPMPIPN